MFDKIRLKDGRTASIVEVFSDTDFLADIDIAKDDWETEDITRDQIAKIMND